MERKKIFRSVWFWVVLVVLLALTFSSFFRGNGGYQEVSTSVALEQFADG
ncbi:MAG: ATP-dependent metalloprotease FtsH, partial [Blastococcus sp.]|nr:ATP-dependent metalloprotease FtsH [Blastococcus sp.]